MQSRAPTSEAQQGTVVQDNPGDSEDSQQGQDHHSTHDPNNVHWLCGEETQEVSLSGTRIDEAFSVQVPGQIPVLSQLPFPTPAQRVRVSATQASLTQKEVTSAATGFVPTYI